MTEVNTPIYTPPASLPKSAVSSEPDHRAEIDSVSRGAVVALFVSGLFWLLVSTFLNFASSVKLQYPEFLNWSFLSYGRVTAAADFVQTYGWCSLGGLGISIWMVLRISNRCAIGKGSALMGVGLWNLGLLLGLASILCGKIRPYYGLEMPEASALLIFGGFALVSVWVLLSLRGTDLNMPIALMFVLAGLCWFGWSFLAGNSLIGCPSITGVDEHLIAAWVDHGVVWMFLTPIGLGIAYFLIPKACGVPIFSGSLGRTCFWLYFLISSLSGANALSGGPLPLWVQSVSAAASVFLLIPIYGAVYNLLSTAKASEIAGRSPAASFTRFALVVLAVVASLGALAALRGVNFNVQFTLFSVGIRTLLLQGFVSMAVFAGVYYVMPRLSGCEWISSSLIKIHFFAAAYGIAMAGGMLLFSGVFSGVDMADSSVAFAQAMQSSAFFYSGRTLSFGILAIGYVAFSLHFLLMLFRIGQPEGEATLFNGENGH